MTQTNSFSIVCRGCGERTEQLVVSAIEQRFKYTAHVNGDPFEETLAKAYSKAIDLGLDYTIMIDCDVIPEYSSLFELHQFARSLPPEHLGTSAKTADKILGRARHVGLRIFRTRYLERLIPLIPTPGESERPETAAHRALEAKGFVYRKAKISCGIHGYHQWIRDLISTTCNLVKKDSSAFQSLVESARRSHDTGHTDYLAMQLGAALGSMSSTEARVSRSCKLDAIKRMMSDFGIEEKPSLQSLPPQLVVTERIRDSIARTGPKNPSRFSKLIHRLCLSQKRSHSVVRDADESANLTR